MAERLAARVSCRTLVHLLHLNRPEGRLHVAQVVKNLPVMQETWLLSLDPEDPLEKEMVTHSIILAWLIPWTEEPGGLQSIASHRARLD